MFNLNNPIPFLFREMWKFSEDRKKYVVLVYFLSTMSNILGLVLPLIIVNGTLNELIKQSPKFKKQWNLYLKSVKKHLD